MVRILIAIAVWAGWTNGAHGQLPEEPLMIGQEVPNYIVPDILWNGRPDSTEVNIRDARLLILDFWDTGCSPCIKAMPKMEALQENFRGSIRILAVTPESRAKIAGFWKSNPVLSDVRMPTAVDDTAMMKLFPHIARPHLIWIRDGVFVAQTNGDYATVEYIEEALDGGRLDWAMKYEFPDFDYSKPLLQIAGKANESRSYNVLWGHQLGLRGHVGIYRDTVAGTVRGTVVNMPVANVYFQLLRKAMGWEAFSSLVRPETFITPNQLVGDVEWPYQRLFYDRHVSLNKPEWDRDNEICFETVFVDSGQDDGQVYRRMLSELDQRLGFGIRFERKRVECLVLRDLDEVNKAKIGDVACTFGSQGVFRGTISKLIYELNQCRAMPPVFNESTRLSNESSLALSLVSGRGLDDINLQLEPHRVGLVWVEMDVDLMVAKKSGD